MRWIVCRWLDDVTDYCNIDSFENMTANPLLAAFDLGAKDRVVTIRESCHTDSSFVFIHLLRYFLQEQAVVCLVNLHQPIYHYRCIGKKLGFDLMKKCDEGYVRVLDVIGNLEHYFLEGTDTSKQIHDLYLQIRRVYEELGAQHPGHRVCLMLDDLSHLHDLGADPPTILNFINCCANLASDDKHVVVLGSHGYNLDDDFICKSLSYVSDTEIDVLPLKTGLSNEVTGVLKVFKNARDEQKTYHYKTYDRGVKIFHPGESLYNLYK